ncbi:hypothetical protein GCM10012289_71410 [Nonomuraea cavernae]|uniref:Uncharacterized protein n=1 Tax=Nonomuraea cavernae TaxID=2045107 RepID=A0A917ZEU9_9ACTN|nr:hypothetical protein GCM10012289_71410 [Nonomuraea cavernae]
MFGQLYPPLSGAEVVPMKNFLKVVVARWLARTPIGLAVVGLAWLLGRRRRQRAEQQDKRGRGRR